MYRSLVWLLKFGSLTATQIAGFARCGGVDYLESQRLNRDGQLSINLGYRGPLFWAAWLSRWDLNRKAPAKISKDELGATRPQGLGQGAHNAITT